MATDSPHLDRFLQLLRPLLAHQVPAVRDAARSLHAWLSPTPLQQAASASSDDALSNLISALGSRGAVDAELAEALSEAWQEVPPGELAGGKLQ